MDERELEAWAEKHRELARDGKRERRMVIAAAVGIVLVLLLLFTGAFADDPGVGIGPSLF